MHAGAAPTSSIPRRDNVSTIPSRPTRAQQEQAEDNKQRGDDGRRHNGRINARSPDQCRPMLATAGHRHHHATTTDCGRVPQSLPSPS
jgi:hypothetical protein